MEIPGIGAAGVVGRAAALGLCALLLLPSGLPAQPAAVPVSTAAAGEYQPAYEVAVSSAAAAPRREKKKRNMWLKWLAGIAVVGVLVAILSSSGGGGGGGGGGGY